MCMAFWSSMKLHLAAESSNFIRADFENAGAYGVGSQQESHQSLSKFFLICLKCILLRYNLETSNQHSVLMSAASEFQQLSVNFGRANCQLKFKCFNLIALIHLYCTQGNYHFIGHAAINFKLLCHVNQFNPNQLYYSMPN